MLWPCQLVRQCLAVKTRVRTVVLLTVRRKHTQCSVIPVSLVVRFWSLSLSGKPHSVLSGGDQEAREKSTDPQGSHPSRGDSRREGSGRALVFEHLTLCCWLESRAVPSTLAAVPLRLGSSTSIAPWPRRHGRAGSVAATGACMVESHRPGQQYLNLVIKSCWIFLHNL